MCDRYSIIYSIYDPKVGKTRKRYHKDMKFDSYLEAYIYAEYEAKKLLITQFPDLLSEVQDKISNIIEDDETDGVSTDYRSTMNAAISSYIRCQVDPIYDSNELTEVRVNWSGQYPNKCSGEWTLFIDGVDYSSKIPNRYEPMNTLGSFSRYGYSKNFSEQRETYQDGLSEDEWVKENKWVRDLPANSHDIYTAFKEKDWRYCSCGGCM